jgi:hypothetical protein
MASKAFYRAAWQGQGMGWSYGPVRRDANRARNDASFAEQRPHVSTARILVADAETAKEARSKLDVSVARSVPRLAP